MQSWDPRCGPGTKQFVSTYCMPAPHLSLGGCSDQSYCTGGETEAQRNEMALPKITQPKTSRLPSSAKRQSGCPTRGPGAACHPGWVRMQPNTKLQIHLKTFFAHQFSLVLYLMCGPRQLPFFQCGPETPKGWTPLVDGRQSGGAPLSGGRGCPAFLIHRDSGCSLVLKSQHVQKAK